MGALVLGGRSGEGAAIDSDNDRVESGESIVKPDPMAPGSIKR